MSNGKKRCTFRVDADREVFVLPPPLLLPLPLRYPKLGNADGKDRTRAPLGVCHVPCAAAPATQQCAARARVSSHTSGPEIQYYYGVNIEYHHHSTYAAHCTLYPVLEETLSGSAK